MTQENPFQKAETIKKRPKIILFGPEGSEKTRFSLSLPSPVTVDMEKGTTLYGSDFDFHVIHTVDPTVVMDSAYWLLTNEHKYKTLIIDPITIYWSALQKKWQDILLEREKKSPGFKFEYYRLQPSDWGLVKGELKKLIRIITMLDMNVVVTAHQKKMYSDNEGEFMKVIGDTFDGEKSLPYMFDIVLRTYKEGTKCMAECLKDRTNKLPQKFKLSYSVISEAFGDDIERESVPIDMITDEQIEEISTAVVEFKIDDMKLKRSLSKYGTSKLAELTKEDANTIIEIFNQKRKERDAKSKLG